MECRHERERSKLGDKAFSLLVRFSTTGAFVAAAFADDMVVVWDPNLCGEHFKDVGVHTEKITCLEFSPDNTLLRVASGVRDRTIQLWSLHSAQRLHRLAAHGGPVMVLAFIPDSQRLCSGSEDNSLYYLGCETGQGSAWNDGTSCGYHHIKCIQ